MEDADAPDPDLMDLVVLLCTRIGMIMEDMSPLAIDASSDVLKGRVWTAVPYSFPYSPKSQFGE